VDQKKDQKIAAFGSSYLSALNSLRFDAVRNL
jgi:hypothetical protein